MAKHCPKEITLAKAKFEYDLLNWKQSAQLAEQAPEVQLLKEQKAEMPSLSEAQARLDASKKQLAKYTKLVKEQKAYVEALAEGQDAKAKIDEEILSFIEAEVGQRPSLPQEVAEWFEWDSRKGRGSVLTRK